MAASSCVPHQLNVEQHRSCPGARQYP
jgi:hypothetical protein